MIVILKTKNKKSFLACLNSFQFNREMACIYTLGKPKEEYYQIAGTLSADKVLGKQLLKEQPDELLITSENIEVPVKICFYKEKEGCLLIGFISVNKYTKEQNPLKK